MKIKISFYLKSGVKSQIPVIALVSYGYKEMDVTKNQYVYKPLRYYTGLKMELADWDKALNLPKQKALQSDLLQLAKKITEVYNYLKMQKGEFSPDELKEALDEKIKGKQATDIKRIRLADFIDNEILTSPDFKPKTKSNYTTLRGHIFDFEEQTSKPFYFNDVNEHTFKLFVNCVRNRETIIKLNSVWSIKKDFVAVLNKIGKKYKIPTFKPADELEKRDNIQPVLEDKIYLDFDQIQTLIDHEPTSKELQNVKLIFLTLIFTGCRYSDVFKIKPENTFERNSIQFRYAQIITDKTDKEAVIPILKPLEQAIEKNGGRMASYMTEKDFNKAVKTLTDIDGLKHEQVLSYTDANGKRQFETKNFNLFITSHTGRRSFITNLINFIPIPVLCKITTHELKDQSVVFAYNKMGLLDNAYHFMRQIKRAKEDFEEDFNFDLI